MPHGRPGADACSGQIRDFTAPRSSIERGLLRGGYEFLEGLAGSIEAGLGHRSQILRQQTSTPERARWFSRIKVIAALDTFAAARPWTCRSPGAILTVR